MQPLTKIVLAKNSEQVTSVRVIFIFLRLRRFWNIPLLCKDVDNLLFFFTKWVLFVCRKI